MLLRAKRGLAFSDGTPKDAYAIAMRMRMHCSQRPLAQKQDRNHEAAEVSEDVDIRRAGTTRCLPAGHHPESLLLPLQNQWASKVSY